MDPYVIFADSCCDLSEDRLKEWGIRYTALNFLFEDSEEVYHNYDLSAKEFYARMRDGHICKTSAANSLDFENVFEPILKEGLDILYIGFSSGLSSTYHCGTMAAEELKERYPDRKIITVDSLAASSGYAMIVYLTKLQKDKGANLEEAARYAESIKLKICHWFTVDDLSHLLRGGRVSKVIATVGGKLNIKPVLHMDNEGHLVPVTVVRGRKNSLKALAERYDKLAQAPGTSPVYICHGDCQEDVDYLASLLKEHHGTAVDMIADVGPVIGAHTGPGVISLFFVGTER